LPSQRTVTTHHLMRRSENCGRSLLVQPSVGLCRWSWPDNTKIDLQRISSHPHRVPRTPRPNPMARLGRPKLVLPAAQVSNSRRTLSEPYLMRILRGSTSHSMPRTPSIQSTGAPSSRSSATPFQAFGVGLGLTTENPPSSTFDATTSPLRSLKAARARDKAAH